MAVLEVINKPECVISLCEYGLEIIQNAAKTACQEGLLAFSASQQLTSALLGKSDVSMDESETRKWALNFNDKPVFFIPSRIWGQLEQAATICVFRLDFSVLGRRPRPLDRQHLLMSFNRGDWTVTMRSTRYGRCHLETVPTCDRPAFYAEPPAHSFHSVVNQIAWNITGECNALPVHFLFFGLQVLNTGCVHSWGQDKYFDAVESLQR